MNAIESNVALLEQGLELLRSVSPERYRDAAPGRSSIGAQYRHVLDHYRALLDGLDATRVDYDARRRNLEVETDRDVAARDTTSLIDRLAGLGDRAADTPVTVVVACAAHLPADPQPSSLGRELHFLVSHTIHHYAIIKLLIGGDDVLPPEFGVAPSTLAWQRRAG